MLFTDALETLALAADRLRDTRAKLLRYADTSVVGDELAAINYKVTQLSKHVAEEADSIVGTLDDLDARIDIRKMIIEKLKDADLTLNAWVEYFDEANANTHSHDEWAALLSTVEIIANHVASADSELTEQTIGDEEA